MAKENRRPMAKAATPMEETIMSFARTTIARTNWMIQAERATVESPHKSLLLALAFAVDMDANPDGVTCTTLDKLAARLCVPIDEVRDRLQSLAQLGWLTVIGGLSEEPAKVQCVHLWLGQEQAP
jgi:hypothetical protein